MDYNVCDVVIGAVDDGMYMVFDIAYAVIEIENKE